MAIPVRFRVRGLSSLIGALNKTCAVINKFQHVIRLFVPPESLTVYDAALTAIMNACENLKAIEYADADAGTTAPWGDR